MIQALLTNSLHSEVFNTFGSVMAYVTGVWDAYDLKLPSYAWEVRKFADKLKEMVALAIGCSRERLEDNDFKNSFLPERWNYTVDQAWLTIRERYTQFPAPNDTLVIELANRHRFEWRRTVRSLIIDMGMYMRKIHPNFWVNTLMSGYVPEAKWIVTDTRFVNEAEAVKEKNAFMIRLERPGNTSPYHKEPSETGLDDYKGWDRVYHNEGSLRDLYEFAREIVSIHQH